MSASPRRQDHIDKTHSLFPDHLDRVFEFRSMLYGFAALWIAYYHFTTSIPMIRALAIPVEFFKRTGACGVDIFLLLTGYGLYHSMQRNPNVLQFYARRLCRIYLTVIPISALIYGFGNYSCGLFLRLVVFPGWWYVRFILILYAVFPLLYLLMRRNRLAIPILFGLTILLTFVCEYVLHLPAKWMREIARLPVFLLGCHLTAVNDRKPIQLKKWLLPVLAGGFVLIFALFNLVSGKSGQELYAFRCLGYLFLAPLTVLLLCTLAALLNRLYIGRIVYRCFSLCGEISLEIYILFSRLLVLLQPVLAPTESGNAVLKLNLFCLILSILLGLLIRTLSDSVQKKLRNIRIPS